MQFIVYGAFWCAIGAIFLLTFVASLCCCCGNDRGFCQRLRDEGLWVKDDLLENPDDASAVPPRDQQLPLGAVNSAA